MSSATLKTPESPAKATYWDKAFKRLPTETSEKLQRLLDPANFEHQGDSDSSATSEDETPSEDEIDIKTNADADILPDQLLKLCRSSKKKYERKKWKIHIGEKEILLHKLWDDTIEVLKRVEKLGDAVAGIDPKADLGWSIAKVFLQIPVKKAEVAAMVAEGLGKAIVVMSRGRVYERQLRDSQAITDKENIKNFERFLIKMYEQTLLFFASACRQYTGGWRGHWYRTWSSVWGSDAITNFEKDTNQVQRDMQDEAATKFQIGIQGDINAIFQSLDELKTLTENRAGRRLAMLEWLSSLSWGEYHFNARDRRTDETGGWIFHRQEYKRFLTSTDPCILWIHGIPGAGKTKLISTLIDSLKPRLAGNSSAADRARYATKYKTKSKDASDESSDIVQYTGQVAFFYCRKDSDDRRYSIPVLRSLIKQIAGSCDVLTPEIMDTYRRKGPGSGVESLSIEDCMGMLESIIDTSGEVLLVLDALDECSEESKKGLLDTFDFLIQCGVQVKIIISSREDPSLSRLEQCANVRISATDNEDDIIKFVRQRIREFKANTHDARRECPRIPPYLEEEIIEKFKEKSGGMFQWASMLIAHLLSLSSADEIKNALPTLPTDLADVYSDIFKLIDCEKISWRNIAIRAFTWLQANGGSCKTSVLVAAACQNPETHDISREMQESTDVLRVCRNLLVLEKETIRFSHLSIQEYFENHRAEARDCRAFAARICLKTLLYYDPQGYKPSPKLYDLWDFSYKNLWMCSTSSSEDTELKDLMDKFLVPCPPSLGYTRWLSRLATDMVRLHVTRWSRLDRRLSSIVFRPTRWLDLALTTPYISPGRGNVRGAFLLLDALVAGLIFKAQSTPWMRLDDFQNVRNQTNPDFRQMIKNRKGHDNPEKDWNSLIERELSWMDRSPILPKRYWHRHEQHRIGEGQCSDNQMQQTNVLWEAARQMYENITKAGGILSLLTMFLAALIRMVAWQLSSKKQQDMPLELLSTHNDADKEPIKIEDLTEFLDNVTKAICQHNMPPKTKLTDWDIGTLTIHDSTHPKRGEKWNFDGLLSLFQRYDPAPPQYLEDLARATLVLLCMKSNSLTALEKQLVEHLFSMFDLSNRRDYQYLRFQKLDVRPLLVTVDQLYETRVVKFLANHGADVNFIADNNTVGSFGTALIAAIRKGEDQSAEIVKFLIDSPHFAHVNGLARVGDFGTALIAACGLGKQKVVELLLKHPDIDINAKVSIGDYGTAMIAACAINDINIVKMLLNKHADVGLHAPQCKHATALTAALDCGSARMVSVLLDEGAPIDEHLKDAIPRGILHAKRRWDCFTQVVFTPVITKYEDTDERALMEEQCDRATKQLNIALIYDQLGVDMEWAALYKKEAILCLSRFSRDSDTDFRAARIFQPGLGFEDQFQPALRKWREVLATSGKAMQTALTDVSDRRRIETVEESWKKISDSVIGLIKAADKDEVDWEKVAGCDNDVETDDGSWFLEDLDDEVDDDDDQELEDMESGADDLGDQNT